MKPSRQELPDRVLFVNLRDGKVFYDCHPAEARAAVETVEEIRSNHGTTQEQQQLSQEIDAVVKCAAGVTKCTDNDVVSFYAITPNLLSDMFTAIETAGGGDKAVTHVVMNAARFGDIRKFNKDVVEMETKVWKLRLGFLATAWSARIIVSAQILTDRVVVMSCFFDDKNKFGGALSKVFVFPDEAACMPPPPKDPGVLQEILERLTKIEEAVKPKTRVARRSKKE